MARKQTAVPKAVKMDPPRGDEYFPARDPRAGFYQAGVIYLVGRDVTEEQATALTDGYGYVWTTTEEAQAALDAAQEPEPETPATEEEVQP
jgi:hypothetical protein